MRAKRVTGCRCPYCDEPLLEREQFCKPCGVEIVYCPECEKPLPRGSNRCPECGKEVKKSPGRKR